MQKLKNLTLAKVLPYILIVSGVVGLICSFIVTMDKLELLKNPKFIPSCDLNPIIACGGVMKSAQAQAFGFPNPWIGLAGFSVLVTIGVALLAGAKFKKWFWAGLEIGLLLGIAFAYWLLYESIFAIQALCPYCLTVDVVLTTVFWYVTLYNFQDGELPVPRQLIGVVNFARKHHLDILILWFVIVFLVILKHFWYYYSKHFF